MAFSASWNSLLAWSASRNRRPTSGSRRCASACVKRLAIEGRLDARHLNRHRPAARSVEFGEDDALPRAQQHGRVANLEAEALPHHHSAQMRIGVLALAIGVVRIVVPPRVLTADELLQKTLHVVEKRVLPLVDENRRGGVQRLKVHDAVTYAALPDNLVDT